MWAESSGDSWLPVSQSEGIRHTAAHDTTRLSLAGGEAGVRKQTHSGKVIHSVCVCAFFSACEMGYIRGCERAALRCTGANVVT